MQVAVQIRVDDLVYNLIGEISSDEFSDDSVEPLEKYLISDLQGMARTKQTGCKTGTKDTTGLSVGGQKLAVLAQVHP